MENNIYLAVDKNGTEAVFPEKPDVGWNEYDIGEWQCLEFISDEKSINKRINLPKGTIEKITGKKLTFETSPLKYK